MQAHFLVSATYEVKMNHREAAEEKIERWEERVPTEKTPSATTEKTLRCYVRGLHTRRRRNQAVVLKRQDHYHPVLCYSPG